MSSALFVRVARLLYKYIPLNIMKCSRAVVMFPKFDRRPFMTGRETFDQWK